MPLPQLQAVNPKNTPGRYSLYRQYRDVFSVSLPPHCGDQHPPPFPSKHPAGPVDSFPVPPFPPWRRWSNSPSVWWTRESSSSVRKNHHLLKLFPKLPPFPPSPGFAGFAWRSLQVFSVTVHTTPVDCALPRPRRPAAAKSTRWISHSTTASPTGGCYANPSFQTGRMAPPRTRPMRCRGKILWPPRFGSCIRGPNPNCPTRSAWRI